jgi:hypothetical protein
LMMVLESWAMQSRVNREYRRRLSTHCWGASYLWLDMLLPTLIVGGGPLGSPGSSCSGRGSVPGSWA